MPDPRLVALLDQTEAAADETDVLIERLCALAALLGEPPEHVPARDVHRRLHAKMARELRDTIAAGRPPLCPHLRVDAPAPTYWLAWAPEKLRCIRCADRETWRIKGTPEDFTCDACQRYSPRSLKWGVYQLPPLIASLAPPLVTPPLIVHFGVCARCEGDER